MSAEALLRAVIAFSPGSHQAEENCAERRYVIAAHRNRLHGKMRNTLQQRSATHREHLARCFSPSDLTVNGRTSPRCASVPLQQPSAPEGVLQKRRSTKNSSPPAVAAVDAGAPLLPHHGSPESLVGRRLLSPAASPGRCDSSDELSDAELDSALQRKQFAKKSLLRTRRVRRPVVSDTPRGVAVSHEHPVLPYRRRQNDILGSGPFANREEERIQGSTELPQLSITGGIRRLMPRLSKIPHLYSEFPR
jgi:hypothetical protein